MRFHPARRRRPRGGAAAHPLLHRRRGRPRPGRGFRGHGEIRRWRENVTSRFTYTVTVLGFENVGDDACVVSADAWVVSAVDPAGIRNGPIAVGLRPSNPLAARARGVAFLCLLLPVTATPSSILLRRGTTADAELLCDLMRGDRQRIAVDEPWRPDDFLTPEGQFRRIDEQLAEEARGRMVCRLIVRGGAVFGTTVRMAVDRLMTFSAAIGRAPSSASPPIPTSPSSCPGWPR
jgi:hypothetical protein